MSGVTSAEICLTTENLESSLASDGMLVYYFNEFLNLPSFSQALMYNQESGLFEVVNPEAQFFSGRMSVALKLCETWLHSGDLPAICRTPPDNRYSVQ
ncbi:PREDICTED: regulator of G-protein signaling 22-like, partial [Cyprinodon variegatus]|uniref:regulator of G-protein signaling 22-like n=1 Tax=Cyprinodon variegatus TaxID=28743 RepID=UPI0007428B0C